jgi:hypothetical protein
MYLGSRVNLKMAQKTMRMGNVEPMTTQVFPSAIGKGIFKITATKNTPSHRRNWMKVKRFVVL